MLSLVANRPLIDWVLERVSLVVESDRVVVATSTDFSDDRLSAHVTGLGYQVFRGELNNVAARFQACLREYPAEWVVRICGDSPLLDPYLISSLSQHCRPDLDIVTNVQKRTFPAGQSVEFINSITYLSIDTGGLPADEQEHLTQTYYRNASRYRIHNVAATDPSWGLQSYVVDTKEDVDAVGSLLEAGQFPSFSGASTREIW